MLVLPCSFYGAFRDDLQLPCVSLIKLVLQKSNFPKVLSHHNRWTQFCWLVLNHIYLSIHLWDHMKAALDHRFHFYPKQNITFPFSNWYENIIHNPLLHRNLPHTWQKVKPHNIEKSHYASKVGYVLNSVNSLLKVLWGKLF